MINYFFYKDYMFNKKIKHSHPLLVSAIMISVIEIFNMLEAYVIFNTFLLRLELNTLTSMTAIMVTAVVVMVLNALYFSKNKERICNKYKGESSLKNVLGYIFYVTYLIGSFVLLFVLKEIFGYHL